MSERIASTLLTGAAVQKHVADIALGTGNQRCFDIAKWLVVDVDNVESPGDLEDGNDSVEPAELSVDLCRDRNWGGGGVVHRHTVKTESCHD